MNSLVTNQEDATTGVGWERGVSRGVSSLSKFMQEVVLLPQPAVRAWQRVTKHTLPSDGCSRNTWYTGFTFILCRLLKVLHWGQWPDVGVQCCSCVWLCVQLCVGMCVWLCVQLCGYVCMTVCTTVWVCVYDCVYNCVGMCVWLCVYNVFVPLRVHVFAALVDEDSGEDSDEEMAGGPGQRQRPQPGRQRQGENLTAIQTDQCCFWLLAACSFYIRLTGTPDPSCIHLWDACTLFSMLCYDTIAASLCFWYHSCQSMLLIP